MLNYRRIINTVINQLHCTMKCFSEEFKQHVIEEYLSQTANFNCDVLFV